MSKERAAPCAIAVFSRAPVPGACKTRLIPRLGAQGAATVQALMVEHALAQAVAIAPDATTLWRPPDENDDEPHPFFARCREKFGVSLAVQRGDDLGARMAHVFARAQQEGRAPTLLMGSDCPAIRAADLAACAQALGQPAHGVDAVFLPTSDGGYGLVGLARSGPALRATLFEAMPWSSAQVMAFTRDRLRAAGSRWREPRLVYDIDEPADLDRLLADPDLRESAPVRWLAARIAEPSPDG